MENALLDGFEVPASFAVGAPDDGDVLDEEQVALRASREAIQPVSEARLQRRMARVDESMPLMRCPVCDRMAPSEGMRTRDWVSEFGGIEGERRCDYRDSCGCGRLLAQERVGPGEGEYTLLLTESLTRLAKTVPHAVAVELARGAPGMALELEVSRVDKSYPETLTEGTRHRRGKGVTPESTGWRRRARRAGC